MSTFVLMYHPLLPATADSPVRVALKSVDEHEAKGWLQVDPEAPSPPAATPYFSREAADSRFAKVADIDDVETATGVALRAASVAAVVDAIEDGDIVVGGAVAADDITDATTIGKSLVKAASQAAARTAIGAGTSNFSGAYSELSGKPTIPGTSYIDAANYGWATGNTAAANGTALTAAIAAMKAQKLPLYLGTGTYQSNIGLDLRADATVYGGFEVFGAGSSDLRTQIIVTDNAQELIRLGGFFNTVRDFAIRHADDPTDAGADGLVFYKAAWNSIKRLRIYNARRLVSIAQQNVNDPGTGAGTNNWFFSCSLEDLHLQNYSASAMFLNGFGGGSTGSTIDNVYIRNVRNNGAMATSSGNPVDLYLQTEMTLRQINIEDHLGFATGVLANACGNIVFDTLHFERASLSSPAWEPSYIRSYGGTMMTLHSVSLSDSNVVPNTGMNFARVASIGAGSVLKIGTLRMEDMSKTQATVFAYGDVDDTVAENALYIGNVTKNAGSILPTVDTNRPGNYGLKQVGIRLYGFGATVRTQTKTAAYTLLAGDAGSVIEVNSASAVTITVPANVLPTDGVVEIVQLGVGQVTLAAGSGMTLRTPASLTTRAQYSSVGIRTRSQTEAVVSGDLT